MSTNFLEITEKSNKLTKCFQRDGKIEELGSKWMKTLNGIFQQSFRKIRITSKQKETNVSKLFDRRFDLKEKQKTSMENDALEEELNAVDDEIAKEISKDKR